MPAARQQILSVSRRTDIPAFYLPWFMERVASGSIDVVNPFNQQVRHIDLTPERFHTMVFWSKNFGPFLAQRCGEQLQQMGYHLFFNFTINSRAPVLEPAVPDLNRRLDQLRRLCRRFGAATVQWRFDPICHFVTSEGAIGDNLTDFDHIAAAAGDCGVPICITSFMDHYRKIHRRARGRMSFVDPSMEVKTSILRDMEQTLTPLGIDLAVCCETAVRDQLPPSSTIGAASCISGPRIMAVHGGRVAQRRDTGQRQGAGCGCTVAVDIGSYALHPCHHNCLFCYANPACDQRHWP